MRLAVRPVAGALGLLLVLLAGCQPQPPSDIGGATSAPAADDLALTTSGAAEAALGDLRAAAPVGALPAGSELVLASSSAPEVPGDLALTVVGEAFDISISDGSQPRAPVEVSLPAPDLDEDEHLVFLVREDGATVWHGLPVEVRAGRASVHLEHFSTGFFGRFRLDGSFRDAVSRFLGQSFPEPDCVGRTVEHDGRIFSVESSNEAIRACVAGRDGELQVEAHSNSGLVWRARGVPGELRPGVEAAPGDGAGELVNLVHRADPRRAETEMVLPPGGRISYRVGDGVEGSYSDLRIDAALGLLAPALAGVTMLVGMTGGGASEVLDLAQCGAGLVTLPEPDADLVAWLAGLLPPLIDCLVVQLEDSHPLAGPVSMALGMVASLPGMFASQVVGAYTEALGQKTARITLTSTPVPVVLSATGVGPVPLGLRPEQALGQLTALLGEPDEVVDREGCFLGGPGWTHYGLRWGGLYTYGEGPAGTLAVDAWSLGADGPQEVRAPDGTWVGMPLADVLATVPATRYQEDTMFGDHVVGADGTVWWVTDGVVSAISGGAGYACE